MIIPRITCELLINILLVLIVNAVDRGNFKTCSDSGFCKRQRAVEEGKSYKVLINTLVVSETHFTVDLVNILNKVHFQLKLSALSDNSLRVKIYEKNPLKPRYEVPIGDALIKEPDEQSITVKTTDGLINAQFGSNDIKIYCNPLKIDIFTNGELVNSINSRGLFKFEHTRTKGTSPDEPDAKPPAEDTEAEPGAVDNEVDTNVKADTPSEEPDLWEETYKTHTDSKPNGPTSIGMDITFPGFQHVYGIPEHADSLSLKSTRNTDPYRLYNLDVFEYELNNPMALYGSVPLMLAHNSKTTVGVLWLNAAETFIDISSNFGDKNIVSKVVDYMKGDEEEPRIDTHWFSESGIIDIFVLLGPKPMNVFKQYAALTGTTSLPPLFAISYHQCRWNYNDQQDVANVDAGFDQHDIPMDVIWLDIEHTDGKRYFTWDKNKFPEPIQMINNVSAKGRKMVNIIDPHIKRDSNYFVYKNAQNLDIFVKDSSGKEYDGWCWPGSSSYIDFTGPDARHYWASIFQNYPGSTHDLHTWNDMNEPSVFNGPEITMHKDAIHHNGWEHRDVHNVFGEYVHRATYEGLLERGDHKERPFVLSRAFFVGSQRYGAIWTGDNTADWDHLKISIPMILSLNLAGITFSGSDVGGFFKNPDTELLIRWYQTGAFTPFFRAHAHHDTRRREPWLYEPEQLLAIKEAISLRYTFLPYWYTLFYEGELCGAPLARPFWVEFPEDVKHFATENAFMIGSCLLVHPVMDAGVSSVTVSLPGKNEFWYYMKNNKQYEGDQDLYLPVDIFTIPLFQRGGCIVPRKMRKRRSSILMKDDPFTLIITLDKKNEAIGTLYVDDYHSFEYKSGKFAHMQYTFSNNKLVAKKLHSDNSFTSSAWIERIEIIGFQNKLSSIKLHEYDGISDVLLFKHDVSTKTLTIRRPAISILKEFVLTLS